MPNRVIPDPLETALMELLHRDGSAAIEGNEPAFCYDQGGAYRVTGTVRVIKRYELHVIQVSQNGVQTHSSPTRLVCVEFERGLSKAKGGSPSVWRINRQPEHRGDK